MHASVVSHLTGALIRCFEGEEITVQQGKSTSHTHTHSTYKKGRSPVITFSFSVYFWAQFPPSSSLLFMCRHYRQINCLSVGLSVSLFLPACRCPISRCPGFSIRRSLRALIPQPSFLAGLALASCILHILPTRAAHATSQHGSMATWQRQQGNNAASPLLPTCRLAKLCCS